MSNLQVTCTKCNMALEHICNASIKDAVKQIFKFKPGFFPQALKGQLSKHDKEGIDDWEFFTEGYLYALLGKEEARTVLALVDNLIRAAGIDPFTIHSEVYAEIAEVHKEEEERLKRVAENKAKRKQEMLAPAFTTELAKGWKRLEYGHARAWDDRIDSCEQSKHVVRSITLPSSNATLIAGTCAKCKLQFVLTVSRFYDWFTLPQRTPYSKVARGFIKKE